MASSKPLVSVVLAARDAEATIDEAVRSVLGQSLDDLELLVVDDGSRDGTRRAARTRRRRAPGGAAESRAARPRRALDVGLDAARGAYVARMDADDVALPQWLARLVGRIRRPPAAAIVGTGMIDLHDHGRLGTVHRMPEGARAVRWAALFSSPFFHSTVLLDRDVLERHGLRYDLSFGESEDFDLWARLLEHAEGDNLREALVLYRKHPTQASARRAELQRACQRQVALRQIASLEPALDERQADARLARRGGAAAARSRGGRGRARARRARRRPSSGATGAGRRAAQRHGRSRGHAARVTRDGRRYGPRWSSIRRSRCAVSRSSAAGALREQSARPPPDGSRARARPHLSG